MPRKMRVEYPGAIYHVMSRGDRREDIFLDDIDRQDFKASFFSDARAMQPSWPLLPGSGERRLCPSK
jgi:hypothetical protein